MPKASKDRTLQDLWNMLSKKEHQLREVDNRTPKVIATPGTPGYYREHNRKSRHTTTSRNMRLQIENIIGELSDHQRLLTQSIDGDQLRTASQ